MHTSLLVQNIADELEFDIADVEMLINVFVQTAEETLTSLHQAIISNDFENIYIFSHSIKGSAANLMLDKVVELAKKIEIASISKIVINYNELYIELANEIEKIKNEL